MLSDRNIQENMESGDIYIYPFNSHNLTGCGYNLTASFFALSTRKKVLERVIEKNGEYYIWIEPNDTVLICTREYVSVSNKIAGHFHSRVKLVSRGLGHISTTLDPMWTGPLLIAINNPSSKKHKLTLKNAGIPLAFTTLMFAQLVSQTKYIHDNKPARIDILNDYVALEPRMPWLKKSYRSFKAIVNDLEQAIEKRLYLYEIFIHSLIELKENINEKSSNPNHDKFKNDLRRIEIINATEQYFSPNMNEYLKTLLCIKDEIKEEMIDDILNYCRIEKGETWNYVLEELEDRIINKYRWGGILGFWIRNKGTIFYMAFLFVFLILGLLALNFYGAETTSIIAFLALFSALLSPLISPYINEK